MDDSVLLNLSADRPICTLQEDLLERGDFAISLANAICRWSNPDSLVLAVYGPWGHGKTSLKNLVLSLLKNADDSPSIVEFNPWNWTGEDRILEAFFEEVGLAIGETNKSPDSQELALKWKKYATRLALGGSALEHLRTVTDIVGIPLVPLILGSLSQAAKSGAAIGEQASVAHSVTDDIHDETLEGLKQSLHQALLKLDRRVLIVMDDIDRLTKEEIRLLFRIIKCNADFPNVIYFLFFEREVVESALSGLTGSDGRSYMEKIVQAGFDLPQVQQSDIEHVLFSGLDALLKYDGIDERFDADRWRALYREALRPFFQSLRNVRRFLSAFSFELGLFFKDGTLDINFIDLIGQEVLRVFEPDVYTTMAGAKEILIQARHSHLFGRVDNADTVREFESILAKARPEHRDAVSSIIAQLFPKIEWALNNYGHGFGFEEG